MIYIHGIADEDIGIDIGVGLKAKGAQNKFIQSLDAGVQNSGKATIKISHLKKIRRELGDKIKKEFNLPVTVGTKHIGWSKKSSIQFHKHEGRNDYAIQLEINKTLRQKDNRELLIEMISEAIKNIF